MLERPALFIAPLIIIGAVAVVVSAVREKPCQPSATRTCSTGSSETNSSGSASADNKPVDKSGTDDSERPEPDYENHLPKFIQADFIELDKIETISLFRSGVGHDSSDTPSTGETCRSKKHYYSPTLEAQGGWEASRARKALDEAGEPVPPPDESLAAKVYSPVDGVITRVEQTHWGVEVAIRPDSEPGFLIRISHVFEYPETKVGVSVEAGQLIAFTANSTDMVIEWNGGSDSSGRTYLVSYFSVMPDSVFAAYQARGVTSRGQMVVTREWRDAHPFECVGTEFAENYEETRPEDTNVMLTPVSVSIP